MERRQMNVSPDTELPARSQGQQAGQGPREKTLLIDYSW
jgi:hypothetical protein